MGIWPIRRDGELISRILVTVTAAVLLTIIAALALSAPAYAAEGWYLMAPPYEELVTGANRDDIPLSHWKDISGVAYATLEACENKRVKWANEADHELWLWRTKNVHRLNLDIMVPSDTEQMMGRCVPSDDPRLAAPAEFSTSVEAVR
jgi:hypothetical protein